MIFRKVHGASIPAVGLGTSGLHGGTAIEMTEIALDLGYRHIDTAEDYGNEAEIGQALEASGIARTDIFLTSKVWPTHYAPEAFRKAVEGTLERLRTSSLDLLLLHWPAFREDTLEHVVESLNRVREDGLTRHIGVSNFNTTLLERAWSATTYPLVVNQVEYHPFLDQDRLLSKVRENEMAITAYCPLARGRTATDLVLGKIGRLHGKTGAQVALRWLLQRGAIVIPRTADPQHCRENLALFDFELGPEDMNQIAGLAEPDGRIIDPREYAPEWD